jgi:hypothetical protein
VTRHQLSSFARDLPSASASASAPDAPAPDSAPVDQLDLGAWAMSKCGAIARTPGTHAGFRREIPPARVHARAMAIAAARESDKVVGSRRSLLTDLSETLTRRAAQTSTAVGSIERSTELWLTNQQNCGWRVWTRSSPRAGCWMNSRNYRRVSRRPAGTIAWRVPCSAASPGSYSYCIRT